MPVGRRTALAFGAPGETGVYRMPLDPETSRIVADQINTAMRDQAFSWAACHPDDAALLAADLPPAAPLLRIGGAAHAHAVVAAAPSARAPQLGVPLSNVS